MVNNSLELLFQINLQKKMRVTGVITQGAKRIGSPEYVKSYKIAYSNDGKSWTMYKVKGTNEDMVRLSHLYKNMSWLSCLHMNEESLVDKCNCLTV